MNEENYLVFSVIEFRLSNISIWKILISHFMKEEKISSAFHKLPQFICFPNLLSDGAFHLKSQSPFQCMRIGLVQNHCQLWEDIAK